MNILTFALASIRQYRLNAFLCVFTAAAGIALLCIFSLLSHGVSDAFARNAQGIDLVAGAKGSPLQLVLSSVYHADVPVGNIEAEEAAKLARNPQIKTVIPLALGDSYKGFRIAGSTPAYIDLYGGALDHGRMFEKPFEAVAGAHTALAEGARFSGVHGFEEGGESHAQHQYTITGVLKPTGTVLDRLIITSVESVQDLHAGHDHDHGHDHAHEGHDEPAEITALLLQVNSPLAVMTLPRSLNREGALQIAAPSYEIARFAKNLGVGRDAARGMGIILIGLCALILLSALLSSLSARQYDLAVLRVLGAGRAKLFAILMTEGILLAGAGSASGLVLGHALAFWMAQSVGGLDAFLSARDMLLPGVMDIALLGIGLLSGAVASMIPALMAANTDIAGVLAKGRG